MLGYAGVGADQLVKVDPHFTCLGRTRFECPNIGDAWKMQVLESESEVVFSVVWSESAFSVGPLSLHAMDFDSSIDESFVCSNVLSLGDAWLQLTVLPSSSIKTAYPEDELYLQYQKNAHLEQDEAGLRLEVSGGELVFSEVARAPNFYYPVPDGVKVIFRGSVTCPLDSAGD